MSNVCTCTLHLHTFIVYSLHIMSYHWITHWGRVTHICIGNLTIIGSDNGLSPGRRQAITWTNVGLLLIGPLGTNFSEMLIEIHTFSIKKIHLKMSSGKMTAILSRPQCDNKNCELCHYQWYQSLLWKTPVQPLNTKLATTWFSVRATYGMSVETGPWFDLLDDPWEILMRF